VSEEFVVEGLGGGHALAQFQCDDDELAVWLKASARQVASNNTARTFVMHPGDHRVIGYYSLIMHSIARAELGRSARGAPSTVPAVLLGKLALDRRATGQGLGSALLHDAMRRVGSSKPISSPPPARCWSTLFTTRQPRFTSVSASFAWHRGICDYIAR
jgi:GNAT superfamily N-acetyltransferase